MRYTFTGAGPTTPASFAVTDPGSHWQQQNWTLYVSGTLGATGSLQVQVSPDARETPDASSRWFNQGAAIAAIPAGPTQISLRFRKLRFAFTGGDGTTNLVAEVV
jgi:hypothetical protein